MTTFKSNSVINVDIDPVEGSILFEVRDAGKLELRLENLAPTVVRYAALHGLKQRIADAAALGFNSEENRYATAEEKFRAMAGLVEHYNSGSPDWSVRLAGQPKQSLLLRCLVEAYPAKSLEALQAYVAELDAKQKRALLASKALAPIAERLRAQAAPVDAQETAERLLAQLG